MIPYLPSDYDDAIRILRNNHWYQDPTRSVWENPSRTQFVNESQLLANPKNAISSIGMDWDSEMRALNTAWGGIPSKYKGSLASGGLISYDDTKGWNMCLPQKKECNHEWTKYTGLNEVFEYCKRCDVRKS